MKNWKKATAAVLCGVVAAGLCGRKWRQNAKEPCCHQQDRISHCG